VIRRGGDYSNNDLRVSELHTPRNLTALGKSYSAFVRNLKLVLFAGFVLIFGVIISYLSGTSETDFLDNAKNVTEKPTPGQIEVLGAKYEGSDEKGNPYTITADKANRSSEREDGVLFENPVTDIILDNKTWIALKAAGGFFNSGDENIILENEVRAYHDSGYEITMKDIVVNLKNKSGSTAKPVKVQGPMGEALAQNMEVKPGLEKIIFGGPVTITLFNLSFLKK